MRSGDFVTTVGKIKILIDQYKGGLILPCEISVPAVVSLDGKHKAVGVVEQFESTTHFLLDLTPGEFAPLHTLPNWTKDEKTGFLIDEKGGLYDVKYPDTFSINGIASLIPATELFPRKSYESTRVDDKFIKDYVNGTRVYIMSGELKMRVLSFRHYLYNQQETEIRKVFKRSFFDSTDGYFYPRVLRLKNQTAVIKSIAYVDMHGKLSVMDTRHIKKV